MDINWREIKQGTIVEFHPKRDKSRSYNAPEGALAEFLRVTTERRIYVNWLDREKYKGHTQKDGRYYYRLFELLEPKGDGETTCRYCGDKMTPVLYGKETFKICHKCEL